ncbi:MAG: ParB/RepB/Spo0J family partition protein [Frankiaceae bacterium]
MSVRRGGLGRGLGALIPSPTERVGGAATQLHPPMDAPSAADPTPVVGAVFREVAVDAIRPNPRQPRESFDEEAHAELMVSIREVGVLQPVVVRETNPGAYELVMGERRWRACRDLGLPNVPAIVRSTSDDVMLRDALLENLHRLQLNPLEEAAAYEQLLAEFGVTHEELAARLGRSRSHVTNMMRLLGLPAAVQRRVAAGVLSAGHARALLGLESASEQVRLAERVVSEGLSVRSIEELVALGARAPARRRRDSSRRESPFADVAAHLSERFETRVSVDMGRSKGRIIVEFAGTEDLNRILAAMGPGGARPEPLGAEQ